MILEKQKGKRYFFAHKCYNQITLESAWPTNVYIYSIRKVRPNIAKYSGKYMYYIADELSYLHINKQDIFDMLDMLAKTGKLESAYNKYSKKLAISISDIIRVYNEKMNTHLCYNPDDVRHIQEALWFDASCANDFSQIHKLSEDYHDYNIEVYDIKSFEPLIEYNQKEIKYMEDERKKQNRLSIFNSFLKDSVSKILEEDFGLEYNLGTGCFRFADVRCFREFLNRAITDIICKRLEEEGVRLNGNVETNIRSFSINPVSIDIIDASKIVIDEKEVNHG